MAAKSTFALVEILENSPGYTPEAIKVVEAEIEAREINIAELRKLAKEIVSQMAAQQMEQLNPLNDDLVIPESHFLTKKEVKAIYLKALKELMDKKEGFRFDVWKYAIGGF